MNNEPISIQLYLNDIYTLLLHKRNNNSNLYINNFISTQLTRQSILENIAQKMPFMAW